MMRKYLLLMSALLAVSIPAVPAIAQNKPAARLDDQATLAKGNIDRLQARFSEYTAGKRSDRDGYIILRQLLNNYQVLRADTSAPAVEAQSKLNQLLKAHPEFKRLTDNRLSDEIQADKRKGEERDTVVRRARAWTPPDKQPIGYVGAGRELAVRYQFRIDFYRLSDDTGLDIQPGPSLTLTKQGAGAVKLSDLRPIKTLTFQQSFELLPRMVERSWTGPMLACTHLSSRYGPRDTSEDENIEALGHKNTLPYVNRAGQLKDFCAAISLSGEILFHFPVSPRAPDQVLAPVGVTPDGKVAVALGRNVKTFDGDGEVMRPGNFREILIWQDATGLRRIPLTPKVGRLRDIEVKFYRNEF